MYFTSIANKLGVSFCLVAALACSETSSKLAGSSPQDESGGPGGDNLGEGMGDDTGGASGAYEVYVEYGRRMNAILEEASK